MVLFYGKASRSGRKDKRSFSTRHAVSVEIEKDLILYTGLIHKQPIVNSSVKKLLGRRRENNILEMLTSGQRSLQEEIFYTTPAVVVQWCGRRLLAR